MKRIFVFIYTILLAFLLTGCNEIESTLQVEQEPTPVAFPFEIDGTTFDKAVNSVVSLSPAITEIIYELGYGDKVIGRSSYCDYPAAVSSKTDVGSSANPDITKIIELKPEVLISQSPIASKDVIKLNNSGVKVLILESPSNYSQLKNNYLQVAMLFVGAVDAKQSAELTLSPLSDELQGIQKSGTFAYIITDDLAVSTGETLSSEILSYFSDNVALEYKNYSISPEELTAKNPDIIFLANPLTKEGLSEKYPDIIGERRVINVDNSAFERPTVRTITDLVKSIKNQMGYEIPSETIAEDTNLPETQAENQ